MAGGKGAQRPNLHLHLRAQRSGKPALVNGGSIRPDCGTFGAVEPFGACRAARRVLGYRVQHSLIQRNSANLVELRIITH